MGFEINMMKNLIKVLFVLISTLSYSYFFASKIPKGKFRLVTLLPVFSLNFLLPLSLTSLYSVSLVSFSISWLANFKLLLFAFDQGPLSLSKNPITFLHFFSIACVPIRIKPNPSPQIKTSANSIMSHINLAIKVLLFALLIRVYDYKQQINPKIIVIFYSIHIYLFAEITLGFVQILVRILFHVELEPFFNEPYLSTSLQDFWGRRWNLAASSILRSTVYGPVQSISTPMLGKMWALLPALLASFLVSGIMHEVMYFHITRVGPTGEVTWFFLIHGICLAMEVGVKKALIGRFQFHPLISMMLVGMFTYVTGIWLFFPQLLRNGADLKVIEEYWEMVEFVKHNVISLKG